MATVLTFASLKADVANYLDRGMDATSDPITYAQIPRLINLAERQIAYDLQIEGFQQVVSSQLQAGLAVYQKPDRWRRTISINIGTGSNFNGRAQVFPRSYEFVRAYSPDDTVTGQPRYYADYNADNIIFGPTPDQAYPWELVYYEQPPLLDDSNQQNWLSTLAPNLLLYGTLLQCAPFLKNDERIGTWQGMYQEALEAISQNDIKKIVDRNATRQAV
jgi:hypothetical protein